MAKVELAKELVNNHNIDEITQYLYKLMRQVQGAYEAAAGSGHDSLLWSCRGEIDQVTDILRELEKQRQAREAFKL